MRCPRDSLNYRVVWSLPLAGPEARGGPGWDTIWGWGNACNTIAHSRDSTLGIFEYLHTCSPLC